MADRCVQRSILALACADLPLTCPSSAPVLLLSCPCPAPYLPLPARLPEQDSAWLLDGEAAAKLACSAQQLHHAHAPAPSSGDAAQQHGRGKEQASGGLFWAGQLMQGVLGSPIVAADCHVVIVGCYTAWEVGFFDLPSPNQPQFAIAQSSTAATQSIFLP